MKRLPLKHATAAVLRPAWAILHNLNKPRASIR